MPAGISHCEAIFHTRSVFHKSRKGFISLKNTYALYQSIGIFLAEKERFLRSPMQLQAALRASSVAVCSAGLPKQSPGLFGLRPSNLFRTKRNNHRNGGCSFWRRRRDSNSRTVLSVTRFPVVRPRPAKRLLRIINFALNCACLLYHSKSTMST